MPYNINTQPLYTNRILGHIVINDYPLKSPWFLDAVIPLEMENANALALNSKNACWRYKHLGAIYDC